MAYSRILEDCPQTFVKDGKCVFGTFPGHSERLDIRGVSRAYLDLPIPKWITNLRIKSRLSFFFNVGEYLGYIDFFDAKIFGLAEVTFWSTSTKQRFSYRTLTGPRKRLVPHNLISAATSSYKKARYIRVSWDRAHNRLSAIFNLRGDSVRPGVNGVVQARFSDPQSTEITCVVPAPTLRRCSARYYASMPVKGTLTLVPAHENPVPMEDSQGVSFFEINRTYMKFRSFAEFATGLGYIGEKQITFRIEAGSQDAVDPDRYNANILFYDGKSTPLPPVVITHNYGIMKTWNIQDTENMIDLTFTPISDNHNIINAILFRTEYHAIYGQFNGALVTKDGEKLAINGLLGICRDMNIRL